MLKPLLKKNGADHELFSNFRHFSNLYFLSKVTEKAVAAQLKEQYPVTAHAPHFDFWTGCLEFEMTREQR